MHDSAWGRMLGVLVSPTATFRSIAEKPTWVVPLILLFLLGALATTVVFDRIDMEEAIRDAMVKQGQAVDDEQVEQFAAIQGKIGFGCALGTQLATYPLVALLLMGGVSIFGGKIRFPVSLATTVYAFMPWVIASLLTLVVIFPVKELPLEDVQSGNLLAASPAAFMPDGTSPVLMALLASLNVFSLWTIALLIIGLPITGSLTRGKAMALVFSLWGLWLAFRVGSAVMSSAFGGG